jgi:hypothetical protein
VELSQIAGAARLLSHSRQDIVDGIV